MYDFFLLLIGIIALPKLLYQMAFHKKYRNSLKQRVGIGFPEINKGKKTLIWVHAVSMGETKAIAALAKKLKKRSENVILLFSTVTETGLAEGKKSIPEADYHVFLPFDFNWIIKPIVKRVKPDRVILCETDFWYNFLNASKVEGAHLSVVNGKISVNSLKRFLKFPSFSRKLFSLIDSYCVQSNHYKERFLQLGIPEEKITVTGNIKFDSSFPKLSKEELNNWKLKLGIQPDDHVLVAGSTHDPEEKIILEACEKVWKTDPKLKVLIVPRHPERFDEVAQLLKKRGIEFSRYSEKSSRETPVVLVDAMGVLRQCYQSATLAVVAGSYTPKVGGHNIVEPCWYGVPVLFGPHLHSQPELLELVKEYQAGIQVDSSQLSHAIERLLLDTEQRKSLGQAGSRLVADLKGATDRTINAL